MSESGHVGRRESAGERDVIGAGGPPRISVVTVTYNSIGEIDACLESLERQPVPLELLLIDNASTDGTGGRIRSFAAQHENVTAICNPRNLGLSAANNQALGRVTGEMILFLNPDTIAQEGALAGLMGYLDHRPDVVVVGPANTGPDGRPHQSFHTGWNLLHVLWWRILPYRLARRVSDRVVRFREREVAFVSGACLLIRRSVFEAIGGFDEAYFLTVEDAADLCRRARRSGRVMYYPGVGVVHLTGRSGRSAPPVVRWEGLRGTVYHFTKHHGRLAGLLVTVLFLAGYAARSVAALALSPFRRGMLDRVRDYRRLAGRILRENPALRGRP